LDLLTAQDAEYGAFKTGSEYGAYKTGKDCAPPPPKVLNRPGVELRANLKSISQK